VLFGFNEITLAGFRQFSRSMRDKPHMAETETALIGLIANKGRTMADHSMPAGMSSSEENRNEPGIKAGRTGRIEIELRQVVQLFNTLDPSPFRESDLADEAETYIVDQAIDLPKNVPIEIVVYLPQSELEHAAAIDMAGAVKNYFKMQIGAASAELRELFKTGRLSLLIGFLVLSVSLVIGLLFTGLFENSAISEIMRESFLIFGWVAIWKPSEIFLYAWPPIARRRKLYRRLSEATITVTAS
jgi:hypothetical protein